ncbi:MAG TPA: hypothetical protein VMV45_09560, partial [Casimicrobiaceae bacterium]|nr:hypothetical protein [Casimicrobiaceae bacterium]
MFQSRMVRHGVVILALGLVTPAQALEDARRAPLLTGFESTTVRVASRASLAQRYFVQGMLLAWGFNNAEATRSFASAVDADPRCALCYWGLAWSLGPNVNADMDPGAIARIREAIVHAQALAPRSSPRDRGLIDALAARHPASAANALDEEAYAQSMRTLARSYPDDADIATLAAEALMDLHPYDWWDRDGSARPWTPEISTLLARALALQPAHPG